MSSSNLKKNIRDRLVAIIVHVTDEASRFKSLGEVTGISAATWRTFWNRGGGASGEMIEAVAAAWPQYAFWLATGITDPYSGHVAPPEMDELVESYNDETQEATDYFKYQIELVFGTPPPFRRVKLDLSPLEEIDVLAEMDAMTAPEEAPKANKAGRIDLRSLELGDVGDPEWEKKYKEAKARIEKRREAERRYKLDFLRKRKFAANAK